MAKDYLIDKETGEPYVEDAKGKWRVDIRTGKKFAKGATREKDDRVFIKYKENEPPSKWTGFMKEYWRVPYERQKVDAKIRINPKTGKPLRRGDTRDEDDKEFLGVDKRSFHEDGIHWRENWGYLPKNIEDGKYRINPETKTYWVADDLGDDGKLFKQYDENYVDDDGYYILRFCNGVDRVCIVEGCGKAYKTTSANPKKKCKLHRSIYATAREKKEWKKTGKKRCRAPQVIKQYTGCTDKPKSIKKYFLNASRGKCRRCSTESSYHGQLKNRYRINHEIYYKMVKETGDTCMICGTDYKGMNKDESPNYHLVVDHQEKPFKVRGILCQNCNQGIGYLKHDKDILTSAIKYLERPPVKLANK